MDFSLAHNLIPTTILVKSCWDAFCIMPKQSYEICVLPVVNTMRISVPSSNPLPLSNVVLNSSRALINAEKGKGMYGSTVGHMVLILNRFVPNVPILPMERAVGPMYESEMAKHGKSPV